MQQLDFTQPFQLIYSLGEHPYLGFIIEPHIVQLNQNGSLSLTFKRVFSTTVKDFYPNIEASDLELIKLLDEIEQTNLIKKYHKAAIRPIDFFAKFYTPQVADYFRQKVEKRMLKILDALAKDNKPLYLMSEKDGYPAQSRLHIADESTSVLFHFRRNENETRYFPTLKYKGHRLDFMYKNAEVIVNEQAWLLLDNTLYHFDQALDGKKLTPFLHKRFISVGRETEERYFQTFVTNLIERYHVYAEGFDIRTISEHATPILTLAYVKGMESRLELSFRYGDYIFPPGIENNVTVKMKHDPSSDSYTFLRIRRSVSWEKAQIDTLLALGLRETRGLTSMSFQAMENDTTSNNTLEWLHQHSQELVSKGFEIQQMRDDKKLFLGQMTIEMTVEEDNDWFDIKAVVHFGKFSIPFVQLRNHILHRIQEFTLPNGEIAIIPEAWFSEYEHLFHFSKGNDELKLSKMHVGVLQELGENTTKSFQRKLQRLSDFDQIEDIPSPADFKGELRSYQKAGYNWFNFLRQYRFGGVLADDMGLGKTIQTLAFLQHTKDSRAKDDPTTSLLIVPTSLIYNWKKEANTFVPNIKIHLHTGSNRLKDETKFTPYDLIITTYGIMRSDEELLAKFFFNYIILDESQVIKNAGSKSFKTAKTLKSKNKLALSGTPIENSVGDIWAQMHFVNPGLLGSHSYFQREFVLPIEKKKDVDKANLLQAIIKPFVLRRTKNQVAQELPPKTEQVIYCKMNEEQSDLYEKTKSEYRNLLLEGAMINKNTSFTFLQGLMKLRQIANHPKLIQSDYEGGSGKFDTAIEMLDSVYNEGNKILIFSQFVKHLHLFREHFEQKNIKYAYLDGATTSREEVVQQFKDDKETKVFLISIKAGGVGLNLTEADYVFILDPWWNPAVEQQAIDRSHRIGQKRTVFIYRFISKDTVEEKIVQLQNKKKSYATSLITTEESFVKSLSAQDMKVLLD